MVYIVLSSSYSPKEIIKIKQVLNQIISKENDVKLIFMFFKDFIEQYKE